MVNIALSILALVMQVTPPPAPPVLVTPAPSPSASALPGPSPSPAALTASSSAIQLHPSQSQVVTVNGASGTITAQVDSPLVTAVVDQNAHTVTVTAAAQPGAGTLTIADSSGASLQLPIRVAFDAGSVAGPIGLRVTGNSIDPNWLQRQVQQVVLQAVRLEPGAAQPQLGEFALPSPFAPGAVAAVAVPVHLAGGDQYFDVDTTATVNLQNVDTPAFDPSLLFYDDDPEKIVADGVLYRNEVTQTAPIRLYYYHQNASDQRALLVVLRAMQTPATVQLIDSSAGPNPDVMTVGHNVSREALLRKASNQGVIVDVTPGAPFIADQFVMKPLDGAAGSIGMKVLSGGAVQVTVLAVPQDALPAQLGAYLDQPALPGDGHHRTGTFQLSNYGADSLAYTVGGSDASTQYGATTPAPAVQPSGRDYGDYGVIRTLTIALSNPSTQPATVYLYERPMGGDVRSNFLVDGSLVELGCARLSQRYQIGQPLSLQPGATSQVVVQTMTDGGSNYPLEVGVTAATPLPTTPPITAPDGCFPKSQPAPQAAPLRLSVASAKLMAS